MMRGLWALVLAASAARAAELPLDWKVDPVTRYVRVSYRVPAEALPVVTVRCEAAFAAGDWRPAAVLPHVSETALALFAEPDWNDGMLRGMLVERGAAGLRRAVVWNPFPSAKGRQTARFRITLQDGSRTIGRGEAQIELDNRDVVLLDDWSRVIQRERVSAEPPPGKAVWRLRNGALEAGEKGVELPPLTYPLDLRGTYAIFVNVPAGLGAIELRTSGEERPQIFSNGREREEVLWQWKDLTRQHLVVRQPWRTVHEHEDRYRARLNYVRLVPLTPESVRELDERWNPAGERRLLAGYNEPYSWAFYEKVESPLQHWEPLLAFGEARVDLLDIQFGRAGARLVDETRAGDQLLADTLGEPVRGVVPRTGNVGRMQQYTNMLETQLKYARQLGMAPFANLGATACYPKTPLESDFSRKHPEWRAGNALRYDVPEVRQYVLSLFREALEAGAGDLSLDWCRYPDSLKDKETATVFFRELRALADEWGARRGRRVRIMSRFPARGVRAWQYMDYAAWVREGLVDYLCPGNLQGRHMNFDVAEYVAAVKGTRTKLLPAMDGLEWGLPMPGMWFDRLLAVYGAGADGVYIYQCDSPTLGSPVTRRYIAMSGSPEALRRWKRRETALQADYSKGIYLQSSSREFKYAPYERLRVWVEGMAAPGTVELLVDGKRINRYGRPPYVLASEELAGDHTIPPGPHTLKVRVQDGRAWLEREFGVEFTR